MADRVAVVVGLVCCVTAVLSLFWPWTRTVTEVPSGRTYSFDCGSPILRKHYSDSEARTIEPYMGSSRSPSQQAWSGCSYDLSERPLKAGFMAVAGISLLAIGVLRPGWKGCVVLLGVAGLAIYGALPGLFSDSQHW